MLAGYGTGAIMAVPGHDERDYEFAKAFALPIVEVVSGGNIAECAHTDIENGTMINSDYLDGLDVKAAKEKIVEMLAKDGKATPKTNFKLRDWVFSRQRYWGEPIPLVHCEKCGHVALPESELPLLLPDLTEFIPGEGGESPLSRLTDWINTPCPSCGGVAARETDTMPQWAGSSWYFLRYADPDCDMALASKEALEYWLPVDWYNGGMEHTTLHLLYSRFWHKFLYDIGSVPCPEPYAKRTSHGMILGEDGEKMSKSRGNVVNPDEIIDTFGADTMRLYEMFIGDFEKAATWSSSSIKGCKRFLERTYALTEILTDGKVIRDELKGNFHRTIKKVGEDIENLKANTAIAAMMSLLNEIYATKSITKEELRIFLLILAPFAPHLAEELFESVGFGRGVPLEKWPAYDEELCKENSYELAVQINGKIKARIDVAAGASNEDIIAKAKEAVGEHLEGKTIVKELCVPNRLVNIVVR